MWQLDHGEGGMQERLFLISSKPLPSAPPGELSVLTLERRWHAYLADEGQLDKCNFYRILALGPGSDHVQDDQCFFVDVQIVTLDGCVQFTLMLSIGADVWFLKRVDGFPLWFRWTATGFRGAGNWEDDAGFMENALPWEVGVIRFLEVFGPQHVFPLSYFGSEQSSSSGVQAATQPSSIKKKGRGKRTSQ